LSFLNFNLDDRLIQGIESMGFKNPTPIQEQVIPGILKGNDIIATAQTGTGKTAAFLLPIVNRIITTKHDDHIKALIIVPTRELAIQIDQNLEGLAYFTHISSLPVYGGGAGDLFLREKKALMHGSDIVTCTPGRMQAHLKMGYVSFKDLQYLVLDEADRMLDMGFYDDIMNIISHLPVRRQNLLFSATMPNKFRDLAKKVTNNPQEINISMSKPPEKILQVSFIIYENQKLPLLKHVLNAKHLKSVLIFCSKKVKAKELNRELTKAGFSSYDIHSDLDQETRNRVITSFKNKQHTILVATDIMSRGIDVEDIDLVINYDVPSDGEDYVHRVGRTARAESKGAAFTFVNVDDQQKFSYIEKLLGKPVSKARLPEFLGDGPEYNPRSGSRKKNVRKFNKPNKKRGNSHQRNKVNKKR
jgi:superfamily II DNA/RNA helicase